VSEGAARWWGSEILDRGRWGAIVEPLLERLVVARDRGRLPHALLLVGPPGLGRELAAVEAAVLTVCGEAPRPWDEGPCADRVRRGLHPDVVAMMPEGRARTIKIDSLREELVEVVGSRPYEGRRRVWILDGVEEERLPKASGNAILKTLEEPPGHALFLLLAANPDAVLPTIRSRCQRLSLPGVVAVARRCLDDARLPELAASALAGADVESAAAAVRGALEAGLAGDPERLLLLVHALPDEVPAFAAAAAVAAELASEREAESAGEELARLAVALLERERRSRALNLNPRTQMVSCLMKWYRELQ
jgi:DNA polymerase-3 subunit delta'